MQNGHCVRYVNVPLGQWNGLRSEDEAASAPVVANKSPLKASVALEISL
jgi:hypothetical protein